MKKILGIIIVAALLIGGTKAVTKSKELADPGKGGLKSVNMSYDPGKGGL
ncbi:hypothetical protein [Neobacillus sp. 19]